MTCRHFRYEVPREYADELRDADPEPCPVCDVLPHRKALAVKKPTATATVAQVSFQPIANKVRFARLRGSREEIRPLMTTPG